MALRQVDLDVLAVMESGERSAHGRRYSLSCPHDLARALSISQTAARLRVYQLLDAGIVEVFARRRCGRRGGLCPVVAISHLGAVVSAVEGSST